MARRKEEQLNTIEQNRQKQEQQPLMHKGHARILSSREVLGDLGNWNIVKNKRSSPVNTNLPITEVDNKFDSLAQEGDTNNGEDDNMTNKDKASVHVGESTKDWINKSFGLVRQDEKEKQKEQVGNHNNENLIVESAQQNLMGTKGSGNEQDSNEKVIPSVESDGKSANTREKYQNSNNKDSPDYIKIHEINSQSKEEEKEELSNNSPISITSHHKEGRTENKKL
ncbi:hypothetical protein KY285_000762 [Solanum tuberosum]|nr:hypothetical protein KY285_000762 [Solanum tuberosum]